ncbi:MAG TPA: hypothetical protein VK983_03025 [Candidatus Limnocylindrales bacterium]|nr:hypothetical protein [Candidatus Limnocylindrales bacterium]
MSFHGSESYYPLFSYPDLEHLVGEQILELVDVLDAGCADTVPAAGFIDVTLERSMPGMERYTSALASVLSGRPADRNEQTASHNAFHFAYTVGRLVLPEEPRLAFASLYAEDLTADALQDKLIEETGVYLGRCEHLDALTRLYMKDLDPTGLYAHIAETVAGSTFMLIDEGEKDRIITETVTDFGSIIPDGISDNLS